MYGKPNPISLVPGALDSLTGKRVLVVGGTAGIGQALSRHCAAAGALVTVLGRTNRDQGRASTTFVRCDLSLMSQVQRTAATLPVEEFDLVAFTAGIVPGSTRQATAEGIELDMATSALSRWVMLQALLPRLKASARILVWGFPGAAGTAAKAQLGDLNSEQAYAGGFAAPHVRAAGCLPSPWPPARFTHLAQWLTPNPTPRGARR